MIVMLDLKSIDTLKNVLELQKTSYTIEAEIIGFYDIPPLKDSLNSLQNCGETFYGYFVDDLLSGIISYKIEKNVLDIHRVAVHPKYFRRGIAKELIHFVEMENKVDKLLVSTGKANLPAVNLYLRLGFNKVEYIGVSEGIYITVFEKKLLT